MEALVPLENELRLVQAYLYIQQERFDKRIQVVWQLETETTVLIPSLTNQPLIENALKHGILKLSEGGTIHIRIINFDTHLKNALPAVINIHIRLQHHYGQGLRMTSKLHEGTVFHLW